MKLTYELTIPEETTLIEAESLLAEIKEAFRRRDWEIPRRKGRFFRDPGFTDRCRSRRSKE